MWKRKIFFAQEDAEGCGREGLTRFTFRYLIHLACVDGVLERDHDQLEKPSNGQPLRPPVKKSSEFEQKVTKATKDAPATHGEVGLGKRIGDEECLKVLMSKSRRSV